jgi:cytochrome c oxidase cbb3-type subunit 2
MHEEGGAVFRMDGRTVFLGAVTVFSSIMFVVIALPFLTFNPPRSADARPLTAQEERGRTLYASNGCNYCHSQYLRPQDWTGVNSFRTVGRVAQAGDYFYQETLLLGTERTGPDLSQEGGSHTDEWHRAHFYNPRWTSPKSIMPSFSFYYDETGPGSLNQRQEIDDLIAYVQSLGGQAGVERAQRQRALKERLITERGKGNEAIIHEWFQPTWRTVRNPMPPSIRSLTHGKQVFTTNCIGCHGLGGDGKGPATYFISNPAPRNFTDASQQLYFSDGEMYDAILFGVEGTAMPPWGDILTVNDIWDTVNFLRTIPNGGLKHDDLDPSMMISPPDVRPIDATPLAPSNIPGNVPVVTPEGGQGETSPAQTRTAVPGATAVATAQPAASPGQGGEPEPGATGVATGVVPTPVTP